MAAIYILAGLAVVVLNIGNLVPAFVKASSKVPSQVLQHSAALQVCNCIHQRSATAVHVVFTLPDAGNGQSSIAYSQSSETDPVKRGMWGVFEVFFDTIVVCTFTALVILCTGVWQTGEAGSLCNHSIQICFRRRWKRDRIPWLMMFAGSTVLAFLYLHPVLHVGTYSERPGRWIGQIGFRDPCLCRRYCWC